MKAGALPDIIFLMNGLTSVFSRNDFEESCTPPNYIFDAYNLAARI